MLAMFNIPKVLVSATLPPVLLPRLLKACWISEVTEIRVPVTLNLAKYSVISSCKLVDKEGANGYYLPDIVRKIVKHFTTWKKPTSQAIMFCKLKPHTEDARKAVQKLGYSALAYTSDSTNRDEVKQCFGQGHLAPDSGGKAFLCCTSGLGAGVNLSNIALIISRRLRSARRSGR
ncbi:hypothetical protein AYX15_01466 [Cryptococcus neoformans]|nr:hypothetical protein AYX15_01466 [Cryptococcus neoformans var. grubii]